MNILAKFRKGKRVSVAMAAVIVFSIVNPTISYGLSTGPGQPELEGFSPIGVSDMVDPFTGDFSYNLPLLNVPGPGGGYPINLSYSAGVSMEQEASWVGLGWNLNAGSVSRELRGLPDDFNGQKVTKELNQKPNQTFGASIAASDIEILGANVIKNFGINLDANLNLFYNTYNGFDAQAGIGFSLRDASEGAADGQAKNSEVVDKNSGEKQADVSFVERMVKNDERVQKWSSFDNAKHNFSSYFKDIGGNLKGAAMNPVQTLRTISAPSVQDIGYTNPFTSSSYTFNVKTGIDALGTTADLQVNVYYKEQKIAKDDQKRNVPAYGYFYSENNHKNKESGLMDFTLGNQSTLTPSSKILPVPNHTYDIFHVKAQGVSGTVRGYKGGVAKLTDATVKSGKKNVGGGAELNSTGASTKLGVNINGGYAETYSGPWTSGGDALNFLNKYPTSENLEAREFEPVHFKFLGELTAQRNKGTVFSDPRPSKFGLTKRAGAFGAEPKISASMSSSKYSSLTQAVSYRKERERRAKIFQTLNEKEAYNFDGYTRTVTDVSNGSPVNISFASTGIDKDRIGAVRVIDEEGKRFVFGIPAKNKKAKQSTFSVNANYGSSLENVIGKTVSYSPQDNSTSNSKGTDNFYNATTTPEHAHSFLLTEILSEDYADLGTIDGGSDGPSPDDFGDYVKFDYYVHKNFKTKSPAVGANYLPGKLSNNGDDKGSITYYEKDLYYLKTVQTKTHIAVFQLNSVSTPRLDAKGVLNENSSPDDNAAQFRLEKITLYNLDDYTNSPSGATPIKTVNFQYDYSLCDGVPNATSGKLTLKKVYFTVGDEHTKVTLSPYEFGYGFNPSYNQADVDRWSSYQDGGQNPFGSNILYPYSIQDTGITNAYAGAWNLNQISLPTGGVIKVKYESDDYQYVQDRNAQGMYEILGFSSNSSGDLYSTQLGDGDLYMVVKIPGGINSSVSSYVEGIKDSYFKAFLKMKSFGKDKLNPKGSAFSESGTAYDFVEGYMNLDGMPSVLQDGMNNKLVIKVKKLGGHHPIKKAGWLELQTSRTDLLDDSGISLDGFGKFTNGMLGQVGQIISSALDWLVDENSFFTKAAAKGWCKYMRTAPIDGMSFKSIVRLNRPERKIGGGHRVAKVTISDEWNAMDGGSNHEYGQRYSYCLEDGTSSGVAQYEPLTGGEENPFKEPYRYSSNDLVFKNDYLYTELPICEDFYPSASVGYSRVVIENIAYDDLSTGGTGVEVKEFFTAKDYPVQVDYSEISKVNTDLTSKLVVLAGLKYYFQPGFSQGFSVQLNDMHGKPKATSTYNSDRNIIGNAPYQRTEYYYKTKGGYSDQKKNYLDNEVDVFYGDGISGQNLVGVQEDAYFAMRESRQRSISGDFDGNAEYTIPFIFIPTGFPTVDYAYTMTRSAVMNKVISKTGVLEKVVNTINGAQTITEHLAFDHETGEPVVFSFTNEYGSKVYKYNQYAKWYYDEMEGAYQNLGMELYGSATEYAKYLTPGDVLMNSSGQKVWVGSDGSNLTYTNEAGNPAGSIEGYKIVASGHGNNIKAQTGSVETINDPRIIGSVTDEIPFFKAYNNYIKTSTTTTGNLSFIVDCSSSISQSGGFVVNAPIVSEWNSCATTVDTVIYHGVKNSSEVVDLTSSVRTVYNILEILDGGYVRYQVIQEVCTNPLYHQRAIEFELYSAIGDCLQSDGVLVVFDRVPMAYQDFSPFKVYYLGGANAIAIHPDGTSVLGTVYNHADTSTPLRGDLFGCFVGCIQGVLNSGAARYSDDLKVKNYLSSAVNTEVSSNPYRYGIKGIYKQYQTYVYPELRTQNGIQNVGGAAPYFSTMINDDGQYLAYYWTSPTHTGPSKWELVNEITKMDHNGTAIEEKNSIGNYSGVLFGYERTLPIALVQNSTVNEIAYDGFEDYGSGGYLATRKDKNLSLGNQVVLSSPGDAHTGEYSIKSNVASFTPVDLSFGLNLESGKRYILQAWHKVGTPGTVAITAGSGAQNAEVKSANIDGWELVEVVFNASIDNYVGFTAQNGQFDDIKIQPFEASSKCFVYNPLTQKLVAQLDENHFATLYNYDRDQVLVQVKKETNRGIKTIQSTQRVTKKSTSL